MRLVTFEVHGQERIGAVVRNIVIDLNLAHDLYASELAGENEDVPKAFPKTMIDFLRLGEGIKNYASRLEAHVRRLLEADSGGTNDESSMTFRTYTFCLPFQSRPRSSV